jgi:hypothetical protein
MQLMSSLLALATAPVDAGHKGRDHWHPMQRRQLGLDTIADLTPSPIMSAGATSTEQSNAAPTVSTYAFPTTVLQVPVAVVVRCYERLCRCADDVACSMLT